MVGPSDVDTFTSQGFKAQRMESSTLQASMLLESSSGKDSHFLESWSTSVFIHQMHDLSAQSLLLGIDMLELAFINLKVFRAHLTPF